MKIFQAYIGEAQRAFVSAQATAFDAADNTAAGTREYDLFRKIYLDPGIDTDSEPWGLVSWKFDHKSPVSLETFRAFAAQSFANGADCVFINPMIGNEAVYANVWEQGIHCAHTGIEQVAYFLSEQMNLPVAGVSGVESFAFCNYFIANNRFWQRYFDYVGRALALLDEEAARGSEIGMIYSGSGQYERDESASMRIFVIERLFSAFLMQQQDLYIAHYAPTAGDYTRKFGCNMGDMLHHFSRMKQHAIKTDDVAVFRSWDMQRQKLLADWQIHIVWNLDDPFSYPLSDEYRAFRETCRNMTGLDTKMTRLSRTG